jgi:hypothetical protein
MSDIPEHVLDGYRKTLDKFVMRARRIESHSLLSDPQRFVKWVHGSGQLSFADGQGELRFDVPPEEAFESLAARVRPLLLEDDGVNHKRVLAALGAFGRNDAEVIRQRGVLRGAWERATGSTMVAFQIGEARDGAPLVSDVDLAHGWLYGDLVHAKPDVPLAVLDATLDQRYLAAVIVYGQAALATVATLNVVRQAADNGLFELSGAVLTGTVIVSEPMVKPVTAARISPAGTLPDSASGPPGSPPIE